LIDIANVSRKDLYFHPDHGYLKVVQLKQENPDEEDSPIVAIRCCKFDSKGKKSEEEVELDQNELAELTNEFLISVMAHMSSGESMEMSIKVPVHRNVKVDDILKPLEELTMS